MRNPSALALAAVLALATPALAGPPKTKPATAGPKTPKTSPSVKASPAVSAPKANAAPKTHGAPKVKTTPAANTAKPPKGPKTTPAAAGKVKSSSPATVTTTGVAPPPAMPKNPKLAAKLQSSLPMGMTVEQAALGFKNQGQFIAAVNVSRNLGIPFVDLKTSMVDNKLSLGQSIQRLKPTADADVEAARAIRLANQSINQPN